MFSGIKTKQDGDYCMYCNAKIIKAYDFCPKCGNALTMDARRLKEQKDKGIKMELLDSLVDEISDEKSLKVILEKLKTL